jgi:hypothetical protein
MTFSIMAECCYAECHLCQVSCMLIVVNKPFILSVIMPSVIMPSVIMPSAVMLSVIILNVVASRV